MERGGIRRAKEGRRAMTAVAFALGACSILEPPAERAAPPDLVFRQVAVQHYSAGKRTSEGSLRELRYRTEQRRAEGDQLRGVPLDETGRPEGELTAGQGEALLAQSLLHLSGGVRHLGAEGDSLETRACHVDLSTRAIRGEERVVLSGETYRAEAPAFTGVLGSEGYFRLENGARATLDTAERSGDAAPGAAR